MKLYDKVMGVDSGWETNELRTDDREDRLFYFERLAWFYTEDVAEMIVVEEEEEEEKKHCWFVWLKIVKKPRLKEHFVWEKSFREIFLWEMKENGNVQSRSMEVTEVLKEGWRWLWLKFSFAERVALLWKLSYLVDEKKWFKRVNGEGGENKEFSDRESWLEPIHCQFGGSRFVFSHRQYY